MCTQRLDTTLSADRLQYTHESILSKKHDALEIRYFPYPIRILKNNNIVNIVK